MEFEFATGTHINVISWVSRYWLWRSENRNCPHLRVHVVHDLSHFCLPGQFIVLMIKSINYTKALQTAFCNVCKGRSYLKGQDLNSLGPEQTKLLWINPKLAFESQQNLNVFLNRFWKPQHTDKGSSYLWPQTTCDNVILLGQSDYLHLYVQGWNMYIFYRPKWRL